MDKFHRLAIMDSCVVCVWRQLNEETVPACVVVENPVTKKPYMYQAVGTSDLPFVLDWSPCTAGNHHRFLPTVKTQSP